jgi:dynein heavy chain
MYPDEFEKFVKQKCLEQRDLLIKSWVPQCAKTILELKDYWKHFVPLDEEESLELPMKFFSCLATEMSNQLRNMVVDSLEEFVQFFEQYKQGNYFEEYVDLQFVKKSALIIKLYIDDPKIEFQPGFRQIEDMIMNCIGFIIKSAEELPRVEVDLFPFPEYKKYVLRTIRLDEALVGVYIKRVMNVYEANKIGPMRYLDVYKKYADFLNNKADQDVTAFLKNEATNQLEDFEFQINKHNTIRNEIIKSILTVPLNLYSLECNNLHSDLADRVFKLKERLVQHCIDHNRETNKA